MTTTTADRTTTGAAAAIIAAAREAGWDVQRRGGDLRSRFVKGDTAISVDWTPTGRVSYADRRVADEQGSALMDMGGTWTVREVHSSRSRGKRAAVLAWLR